MIDFRSMAINAFEQAKKQLSENNDIKLNYAALELRFCLEYMTYDRARAYHDEIPDIESLSWQPNKLMSELLELDPFADAKASISIGLQKKYGERSEDMQLLGTENPITLKLLKDHYNALGSFLHAPTLKQFRAFSTAAESMRLPFPAHL